MYISTHAQVPSRYQDTAKDTTLVGLSCRSGLTAAQVRRHTTVILMIGLIALLPKSVATAYSVVMHHRGAHL